MTEQRGYKFITEAKLSDMGLYSKYSMVGGSAVSCNVINPSLSGLSLSNLSPYVGFCSKQKAC
jgi:hypothetical protein